MSLFKYDILRMQSGMEFAFHSEILLYILPLSVLGFMASLSIDFSL